MNFYINDIKINTIANLGALNIGFNILSDNRATQTAEGANEKTTPAVPEGELPPPHPAV